MAESVNGYYKAELVRGPAKSGPWKTIDDLELATLGWVHWHNTERLHGYLGDVPPAEFEAAFYAGATSAKELVEIKRAESPLNSGRIIILKQSGFCSVLLSGDALQQDVNLCLDDALLAQSWIS